MSVKLLLIYLLIYIYLYMFKYKILGVKNYVMLGLCINNVVLRYMVKWELFFWFLVLLILKSIRGRGYF